MLYVQQSLTPGEELIHVGHFHWIYTVSALLNIVWGVVGCIFVIAAAIWFKANYGAPFASESILGMIKETHPLVRMGAFMVLVFGLLRFATMMMIKASTEIAVTSSRLIYKRGLVARSVGEMSIDRIEGVNVLQSVTGRMLDYGRIMVRGMGVGEVLLPELADPLSFRKAIEKARIA